jgi:hypothetical protein
MSVALTINVGSSITVQARDPRIVAVGTSGPAGPPNSLSVSGTTTVAYGTPASVAVSGTAPTQSLAFTIPTGAAGDWSTAQTLNAQTGTTYTLVAGDVGKLVTLTNSAAIAVTVPTGIATVGQRIDLAQLGAGQVTVSAGSGVTINSTPTAKLRTQYSAATLICTATTATPTATYLLVGDLAAV